MQTGRDRMRRNREGIKMPSDGNKEEEEGDGEVIILCSTYVERVIPVGKTERKFTQNLSHGTSRSIRFRGTKHGTKRFVPLRSVSSHVPNGSLRMEKKRYLFWEVLLALQKSYSTLFTSVFFFPNIESLECRMRFLECQ
ncbi:hypothetical protein DVH24_022237 [Malus domestica]|uniref:Uncharacterized protein n=1 Tax=Malus domestica TaxID=3750 RepID=A0A498IXW2_MALDO|nr:hypothetical protein DVH24_022237 [Malus domestica]